MSNFDTFMQKQIENALSEEKPRYQKKISIKINRKLKKCTCSIYSQKIQFHPYDQNAGDVFQPIILSLTLISLQPGGQNRLILVSTEKSKKFKIEFDNEEECEDFKDICQNAMMLAFAENTEFYDEIRSNPSYRYCADCRMDNPHWVAMDFYVVVCEKCAGFHRKLGVHYSRMFSVLLDVKSANPNVIMLLKVLGNDRANRVWEGDIYKHPCTTIEYDSRPSDRHKYILDKYIRRKFFNQYSETDEPSKLNQIFLDTALQAGYDIEEAVEELLRIGLSGGVVEENREAFLDDLPEYISYFMKAVSNKNRELRKIKEMNNGFPFEKRHCSGSLRLEKDSHLTDRYCILEDTCFTMYDDNDKMTERARGRIELNEITMIGYYTKTVLEQNSRIAAQVPGFQIFSTKKTYKFVSKSEDADRSVWTMPLISTFAPASFIGLIDENINVLKRIGFLDRSMPHEKPHKIFLMLKGKSVYTLDTSIRGSRIEIWDIRKLAKIGIENVKAQSALELIILGTIYTLHGSRRDEILAWHDDIKTHAYESSWELHNQQLRDDDTPIIVAKCIDFVTIYGLDFEGIYRKAGVKSKVKSLLEEFILDASSVKLSLDEHPIEQVSGCLKLFFKSMKEPLLTKALIPKFLKASGSKDDIKLESYTQCINMMPSVYKAALRQLIRHLRHITEYSDVNKMTSSNLAAIFVASLTGGESVEDLIQTNFKTLIMDLIQNYSKVFQIKEHELHIEKTMYDAMTRINKKPPVIKVNRIEIKVCTEDEPNNQTLTIEKDISVEEAILMLSSSNQEVSHLMMVENRFNCQLQRLLPFDEKILEFHTHAKFVDDPSFSISLERASKFTDIFQTTSKDNWYSVVCYFRRKDNAVDSILSVNDGILRLHPKNDPNMTKPPKFQCNIRDLTIYNGAEINRLHKEKFGISVKTREGQFHSFLFKTLEERNQWLHWLISIRHPQGHQLWK